MGFELIPFSSESSGLIQKQAVAELMQCNDYSAKFGLTLTQTQAIELVETRSHALSSNGRIEFGGGVIDKIIKAFCDSPYLSMQDYAQILHELTELFYFYKNETLDLVSDDELIQFMKTAYDGLCQGSLDLLDRELYRMAENTHFGRAADASEPDDLNGGAEEEDE